MEDEPNASMKVQRSEQSAETHDIGPEELIDDLDVPKILKQADRTLASAWKFNPLKGAAPGCLDPMPSEYELTKDEFEFLNKRKIKSDTRGDRKERADTARGLFELQNIRKRNKKNLVIEPWPKDIPFLNDQRFATEVNINAFSGHNFISKTCE